MDLMSSKNSLERCMPDMVYNAFVCIIFGGGGSSSLAEFMSVALVCVGSVSGL